jgi:hypothetical protein
MYVNTHTHNTHIIYLCTHTHTRQGKEVVNGALGRELKRKCEFTSEEWAGFGVRGLTAMSYIKVGDGYFKPSAPAGALSPLLLLFIFLLSLSYMLLYIL